MFKWIRFVLEREEIGAFLLELVRVLEDGRVTLEEVGALLDRAKELLDALKITV